MDEICDLLYAETDDTQRLCQNSPFAGILSPAEVWEIKNEFRKEAVSQRENNSVFTQSVV